MKKTLLVATVLLLASGATSLRAASPFEFGVKASYIVDMSNLKYKPTGGSQNPYDKNSTGSGFDLGVQARVNFPLVSLFIQPELLYSRSSAKFASDPNVTGGDYVKLRTNWIEVPVLLGWEIIPNLRLMAGPSFRFPMDEVANSGGQSQRVNFQLQEFVMGYQVGLGLDLGRLTLDARYCGDFTNITDSGITTTDITNVKVKEQKVTFSVGWMFLK